MSAPSYQIDLLFAMGLVRYSSFPVGVMVFQLVRSDFEMVWLRSYRLRFGFWWWSVREGKSEVKVVVFAFRNTLPPPLPLLKVPPPSSLGHRKVSDRSFHHVLSSFVEFDHPSVFSGQGERCVMVDFFLFPRRVSVCLYPSKIRPMWLVPPASSLLLLRSCLRLGYCYQV